MSKLINFLKLIRLKNLIIVGITQFLIKFFLINPFIDATALDNTLFCLFVFATLFITAAGYIINDIYDVETDKINKDDKRIIAKSINSRNAIRWYIAFNIIGLLLGSYVAFAIKKPLFSIIFLYCIFSLWSYSKRMKRSFLIGNLQVSFLTALSLINLALFDIIPNGINTLNGEWMIFSIIMYYALFAFITTFIREIIKDLEDLEGDKKIKATTLAITYGIAKTKNIALALSITTIIAISYFQYFQYSIITSEFEYEISFWGVNTIAILYTLLVQILFIFLSIKIYYATRKSDFSFTSGLCKIIMFIGILSIPLFTYLHLN